MAVYTGAKWGTSGTWGTSGGTVTYSFVAAGSVGDYNYLDALDSQEQLAVYYAFEEWSDYADIEFEYTADVNSADIVFGWADSNPSSAGNIQYVGEASYSYYSNGIYFDAEIAFAIDYTGWTTELFYAVALHEIGHAIGLGHFSNSIMEPYAGTYYHLTAADIDAIQDLYGPAEATTVEPFDVAYYYKAVNTSGDIYYGLTVADAGTYTLGSTYGAYYGDTDGGYWTYYVYQTYEFGNETGQEGASLVNGSYYYYDGETGRSYTFTAASGSTGMGSELGRLDGTNEYFGYRGYLEADEPDDAAYYFRAVNTSGDVYYGVAIADIGTYSVGSSYGAYYGDTDGGYWTYYVYNVEYYGAETGAEGTSFVNGQYNYYDGESGTYHGYTSTSGTSGMGSEYGFLSSSGEAFGYNGYYEADDLVDVAYYYKAVNTSGDIYYGLTVADIGTYSTGTTYGAYYGDTDGGYWTYYVYDAVSYGYETGVEGASLINGQYYYYDAESGTYQGYTSTSGTSGIGSELGRLNGTDEYFGYRGYLEADAPSSVNMVTYYAVNSSSGDTQSGFTYDDGTYGYQPGQSWQTGAEGGYGPHSFWEYHISSVSGGYSGWGDEVGYNYIYNYYDAESGISVTPYNYTDGHYTGTYGIGSGTDYADLDGNGIETNEQFSSYYEADYY